jgi:hypothetical protein
VQDANNNYAPPQSPVGDSLPPVTPGPMPRHVLIAIAVICLHCALSVIYHLPYLIRTKCSANIWITWIAGWFLMLLLAYFIARGSRVARIFLWPVAVLYVLAFLMTQVQRAWATPITPLSAIFWIASLILVNTNQANPWFERRR